MSVREITDRIIDTQDKIFDEMKKMREDFNNQRLICENRITKIETENKTNARAIGSIYGGIAAITVFVFKWVWDRVTG